MVLVASAAAAATTAMVAAIYRESKEKEPNCSSASPLVVCVRILLVYGRLLITRHTDVCIYFAEHTQICTVAGTDCSNSSKVGQSRTVELSLNSGVLCNSKNVTRAMVVQPNFHESALLVTFRPPQTGEGHTDNRRRWRG